MKAKERQVADLTTELTSKATQLEQTNKELEAVRLRAVRGGVETERWQMDLNSVRTSNRLLAQQTNELRLRLTDTEGQLASAQRRLISVLKDKDDAPICNGDGDRRDPEKDKEIAALKAEIVDIKAQFENAKENVANLQTVKSELSELKIKYATLKEQLKPVNPNMSEKVNFSLQFFSIGFRQLAHFLCFRIQPTLIQRPLNCCLI